VSSISSSPTVQKLRETDAKFALQTLCAILLELPFYRVADMGGHILKNSAGRVHLAECPVHRLLSAKNAVPGHDREVMMMFRAEASMLFSTNSATAFKGILLGERNDCKSHSSHRQVAGRPEFFMMRLCY